MTTLGDLVIRTRRRVLSDLREETDTLGTSIAANATSITLGSGQTLGSVRAGAILELDYELFLVINTPSSPTGIQVQPGYLDTNSTSHTAGTILTVNPRFPNADIATAINEDIDDLSAPTNGLFQVKEVTITYNPIIVGYDLLGVDPNILEVMELRAYDYGPAQRWPVIPPSQWKVQRLPDPGLSSSGINLKVYGEGYPGRAIRVLYKNAYSTPLVNATDDVFLVTGLHSQAHDIPQLGATIKLMAFRELKRSFSEGQSEPRRAQEVPVGASLTASKGLIELRRMRIDAERTRLLMMFPRQSR